MVVLLSFYWTKVSQLRFIFVLYIYIYIWSKIHVFIIPRIGYEIIAQSS